MSQASAPYHHGDLRAACVRAARELLEESGGSGLSLRAVARRAGVSAAAPYRHYADREELISAVAGEGYRELAGYLAAARPSSRNLDDLAEIAVAYVRFAVEHPALFRVMFAEPCDRDDEERVQATATVWEYVTGVVRTVFPGADTDTLPTSVWAFVHGLAFLHLDGKLDADTPEAVDDRVRAAVHALFAASAQASAEHVRS
ncbi:TetR/AcrR family transcriptional regulator [Nocardiopsis sp. HNM0947]|uniref:TetR/AcrR family transcriptional regulator n=1 Tax=Nocardiopsis coralli TaxID=2772213 RepID=A0ABR9P4F7_9ACTN|nr:TetR/AcrR family transcriptional regulator [Nocardiopsis coralli]MBE2998699.1 TetR/AcrR family transcriptional regulator [Nocardiopsis coralli]